MRSAGLRKVMCIIAVRSHFVHSLSQTRRIWAQTTKRARLQGANPCRVQRARRGGVWVQRRGAGAYRREGQAPPLRRRVYLGAERTAGRRGRRPLRVRDRGFAVGAAALGRPRTWRMAGETGRRGRRPLRVQDRGFAVGAAALGRPRTWRMAGETGRRGRRPLRVQRRGAGAYRREGQAPPLRRRVYLGAERTAGRRGRRPLRGGTGVLP